MSKGEESNLHLVRLHVPVSEYLTHNVTVIKMYEIANIILLFRINLLLQINKSSNELSQ